MGMVISTHLPPPVIIESTDVLRWVTHMLCWSWGVYFSAAASSENDHGSMNLASNTASVPSTMPSRVAAIQGMAECLTWRCTSVTRRPVLRSYQDRLSSSVVAPSCTMRFPDKSSGSASPRFSPQRRTRAASSVPMMIRASEPPMKVRRSTNLRVSSAFLAMWQFPFMEIYVRLGYGHPFGCCLRDDRQRSLRLAHEAGLIGILLTLSRVGVNRNSIKR